MMRETDRRPSGEEEAPAPASSSSWLRLLPIYMTFVVLTVGFAVYYPFPSAFDELQHYSVVRAQFEGLSLFSDPASYRVLDPKDLARWSSVGNYINHPSAYYILLSPLMAFSDNILLARLANVAIIAAAMAVAIRAGVARLSAGPCRPLYALLVVSFPKSALIGGMINNDNLAMLAGALVFAGTVEAPAGIGLSAAGLALAGWSKLTALIAMVVVVAASRVALVLRGRATPLHRSHGLLLAAAAAGSLPYLVNLVRTGHLLYVNAAAFEVPPDRRPTLDFAQFCARFLADLVEKWPANEGVLPFSLAAATLLLPLALARLGSVRGDRAGRIGAAYAIGLLAMLVIHLGFGWSAFEAIGDLTIAQTRYYNVLWPGIAWSGAIGAGALIERRSWLIWPLPALILLPTALGGIALALL